MTRRDLLRFAAGAAGAAILPARPSVAADTPLKIEEATFAQLRAAMESGAATAVSLATAYLDRIAALDKVGPAVNAIAGPLRPTECQAIPTPSAGRGASPLPPGGEGMPPRRGALHSADASR